MNYSNLSLVGAEMLNNMQVTCFAIPGKVLASVDTHCSMKYIVVKVRCHKPEIWLRLS